MNQSRINKSSPISNDVFGIVIGPVIFSLIRILRSWAYSKTLAPGQALIYFYPLVSLAAHANTPI